MASAPLAHVPAVPDGAQRPSWTPFLAPPRSMRAAVAADLYLASVVPGRPSAAQLGQLAVGFLAEKGCVILLAGRCGTRSVFLDARPRQGHRRGRDLLALRIQLAPAHDHRPLSGTTLGDLAPRSLPASGLVAARGLRRPPGVLAPSACRSDGAGSGSAVALYQVDHRGGRKLAGTVPRPVLLAPVLLLASAHEHSARPALRHRPPLAYAQALLGCTGG